MPDDIQRRHDLVAKLFRGEFGDDIYSSVVLSGNRRREITSLRAYVALYPDRKLYFIRVTETRITEQSAHARIKRLRMTDQDIATQYTQIQVLRPGGNPSDMDELMWQLAGARTAPLGLPLALVTFLSTIQNDLKIVFWSSRMAPADWLLKQIHDRIQ